MKRITRPQRKTATPRKQSGARSGKLAARPFAVVGVGASAGGLEAFTELLKHLPTDTGLGFVLVQHLDPQHKSALTEILSRATSMRVHEITNDLRIKANEVYVIPPNTDVGIARGVLTLKPRPAGRAPHHAVDFFLTSLAHDQHDKAIGVILSGTATDGTIGMEAIKAEGGITFAQDASAKYDSMPRSAVSADCVDFILSPEEIAKELSRIARHPHIAAEAPEAVFMPETAVDRSEPAPGRRRKTGRTKNLAPQGGDECYKETLLLLREHSGVDFSLYKTTTLQRRITRRMLLTKKDSLKDYGSFLRGNSGEFQALYHDCLISVTSFFRNPEVFDILEHQIFPRLQQAGSDPMRVWVLGCSTGQEAYSIAIAYAESLENSPGKRKLQVFATDVNDTLLEQARQGLYSRSLVRDVSPQRLKRYFVEEDGGYRVSKSLRETVVFARQNLISDPPFSRMDLISCRNMMIYFDPTLQKKIMPTFHFSLKPGGFLLLGASESIGSYTDLFEPVDRERKIYSRKAAPAQSYQLPLRREFGERTRPGLPIHEGRKQIPNDMRPELTAQREADRVASNKFAPPGVLIDGEMRIIQFRGSTSDYLEPPTGKAGFDLLKMAREGLMLPLRAVINKAIKGNKIARKENAQVRYNQDARKVNIEVIPLKNLRERCYLVLFEEAGTGRTAPGSASAHSQPAVTKSEATRRIAELKRELAETRDYLQSFQEQHEAANDELLSAGEELQSANEELQSLNEELETSKEELESANQELTTINEEMTHRNFELNRLYDNLTKLQAEMARSELRYRRLFEAARDGVLIIDPDTRKILDSNPCMTELLGYPHDALVGREPFEVGLFKDEAASRRAFEELHRNGFFRSDDMPLETRDGQRRDVEFISNLYQEGTGRVIQCNIRDITDSRRIERELSEKARLLDLTGDGIIVRDLHGKITLWNKGAEKLYGWSWEEVRGKDLHSMLRTRFPKPKQEILAQLRHEGQFSGEVVQTARDGRRVLSLCRWVLDHHTESILTTHTDITERKKAEEALRDSEERFRTLFDSSPLAVLVCDRDGVIQHYNSRAVELWGGDPAFRFEQQREPVTMWRPTDLMPHAEGPLTQVLLTGKPVRDIEMVVELPDGTRLPVLANFVALKNTQGEIVGSITSCMDITERKRAEQMRDELLENERSSRLEVETASRVKDEFLATLSHELRTPLNAILGWAEILREDPIDPSDLEKGLAAIQQSARAQAVLIEDMLDMSRIVSGKLRLDMQNVDISAVIESALETVRPAAEAKHIGIDVQIPPQSAHVSGDPIRLQQIIWNLCSNSVKFTPPGGKVELKVVHIPPWVEIQVTDTGQGISPEFLPYVFERFRQADGTTTRRHSGLGLGLAICKNLVELHGGTISVDSPGNGSGATFTVRLPAVIRRIRPEIDDSTEGRTDHLKLNDVQVLVVDDDYDARELLRRILTKQSARVHLAHSAEEALSLMEHAQIDVIVSDIGMPVKDGYEFIRNVRSSQLGSRNTPAIAVTAFARPEDRVLALQAGYNMHVAKPVNPAELLTAVTTLARERED